MKHGRQSAGWYIRRGIALIAGTGTDILCETLHLTGTEKITITCVISLFIVFCFDVYKAGRRENILRLLYIIYSAADGYFGMECFFLFLFDMLVENCEKGDG